jgi:hypothetical protein
MDILRFVPAVGTDLKSVSNAIEVIVIALVNARKMVVKQPIVEHLKIIKKHPLVAFIIDNVKNFTVKTVN